MTLVSLHPGELKRPRILAVDFPEQQLTHLRNLGYEVKRGTSGYDDGKVYSPYALQDVDIALWDVQPNSLTGITNRDVREDSLMTSEELPLLISQLWALRGWSVPFVDPAVDPAEFQTLGLTGLGVWASGGHRLSWSDVVRRGAMGATRGFERLRASTVVTSEDAREAPILERFLPSMSLSILTVEREIHVAGHEGHTKWLLGDTHHVQGALALSVTEFLNSFDQSVRCGCYLLPTCGNATIRLASALITEVIADRSPYLFDRPRWSWLKDYQAAPVQELRQNIDALDEEHQRQRADLERRLKDEESTYAWLDDLLIGTNNDFQAAVGRALDWLGFSVEDMDAKLAPKERRREDFRISRDGFFALVEAKARERGPSEDFITDINKHQTRYGREANVPNPPGFLVVNHSTSLPPSERTGRFYPDQEVHDDCGDTGVTAIDSVALHALCQKVLFGAITQAQAAEWLTKWGPGVIAALRSEESMPTVS